MVHICLKHDCSNQFSIICIKNIAMIFHLCLTHIYMAVYNMELPIHTVYCRSFEIYKNTFPNIEDLTNQKSRNNMKAFMEVCAVGSC